jgi:hypothetical protein
MDTNTNQLTPEPSGNAGPDSLRRLVQLPWVGKLHHDREEFADWGWIRDEAGALIMIVHLPFSPHSPQADEHRRNKTDPTQPRVDAILALLNAGTERPPTKNL